MQETATNETAAAPCLDLLFREARTHIAWQDKPVPDALLKEIYDLAKWGPTSANCSPIHIVFVRSAEAKARLLPAMAANNVE
ncbi:MAG TPA: nitroreductase family protein, partial [Chthonomonadaceae bacterium]|nr:nitroreductase family protein [Chthonomonadaceae bacterium]